VLHGFRLTVTDKGKGPIPDSLSDIDIYPRFTSEVASDLRRFDARDAVLRLSLQSRIVSFSLGMFSPTVIAGITCV
jgi:hypothetical protein